MANRERGERDLKLGGQTYTLKFTTSAYIELEDILNMEAGRIEQLIGTGQMGYRMIRAMIWAGTRKHHRREIRNLEEITDLMDEAEDLTQLFEPVLEAYRAGQPGAKDDPAESEDEKSAKPTARKAS